MGSWLLPAPPLHIPEVLKVHDKELVLFLPPVRPKNCVTSVLPTLLLLQGLSHMCQHSLKSTTELSCICQVQKEKFSHSCTSQSPSSFLCHSLSAAASCLTPFSKILPFLGTQEAAGLSSPLNKQEKQTNKKPVRH
ncbi:Hypothetical predicted protein [Marmota monax]|uniref:Uncharacterized protein n=1 Tax=Marmota monax TaxID=9995 RepID=A0A5E4BEB8_MARMO|nr:Hypothetical predicted protein [Marmota monax]